MGRRCEQAGVPIHGALLFSAQRRQRGPEDRKGPGAPRQAAAREEALVLARELKDGKVLPGRSWDGWFVQIVDQHGHEVDAVPIDAVPE